MVGEVWWGQGRWWQRVHLLMLSEEGPEGQRQETDQIRIVRRSL